MMYNYWFFIWSVCSYLTVLSRYKEQLLTCYLVCYFSHLSLVVMYHGCHMLVLGVLLHLKTSTLFEFCHKLVRRARYLKKKRGKGDLILHTRVKTTTPRPELKTDAVVSYWQCSFCKGKHEQNLWSRQKLKFGCSKYGVTSNWYRKSNKQLWSRSGVVILQSKETKTANKQKNSSLEALSATSTHKGTPMTSYKHDNKDLRRLR